MSKLFVLHGADSKTGVSMLSQSLAELISDQKPQLKVLLVNLQGRYGAAYTNYVGESVEGLRHYLDNRLLDRRELMESCYSGGNLYILGGVSTIGEERQYQPEMSNYLLSELMGEFDLILADSGSELDNGLALGALVMADEVLLVITQQEAVLRRYEKLVPLYKQLRLSVSMVLCNHFDEEDPHSIPYLSQRLDLEGADIRSVAETENGRRAESEAKTLLAYRCRRYRTDITEIAEELLRRAGYEPEEGHKKRRWISFI